MPRSQRLTAAYACRRSQHLLQAASSGIVAVAVLGTTPSLLPAADLPPQLMARFTKHVQPLILNKCAAGACHGGPTAHAPHFNRGDVSGRIDRSVTLANVETLFRVIGKEGNATPFLSTISARHPASSTGASLTMAPLTTAERATLEQWLIAATGRRDLEASRPTAPSTATQASAIPTPNRFRAMLDAAANPPQFPPPKEPQGIILGKDSE
jgi:hypothetical protein